MQHLFPDFIKKAILLNSTMLILRGCFMNSTCIAQEIPESTTGSGKFQIGVTVSPDYCYRTLRNDGNELSDNVVDWRNDIDRPKFGYSSGIHLNYKISKCLFLEGGVQYSLKGFGFKPIYLFLGDQIDPRNGTVYSGGELPEWMKSNLNITYLDVPIRAIFHSGKNRISFITSLGITTNVLLKATYSSIIQNDYGDKVIKVHNNTQNFKSINISPIISAGIAYRLKNNWNIRMEPVFRYGIFKISDSSLATNLWSGGLNVSCLYTLKK